MALNKRKSTTAIVAGVAAVALLIGGTFAWTSISQMALNESAGIVNVGGRLHDDFDGTNKDVYVENFTDPYNGGQPIYARIKLTEYMEVGSEAGQADNADRKATPVVSGTDINDVDSWTTHLPKTDCAVCETEGTCRIHSHWEWQMGGKTTYMPTFNKDKDSLAADINGTYHGTDDTDKVYYDDYVVYTTDNTTGGVDIAEAEKEAHDGEIYSVVGTEYYDDDTDTEDNGGIRWVAGVTHTAKETVNGTVITMDEWINTYNKAPGNYWVYDTDGWAYWANPIMPGEATGLLLSNINMTKNPGEKCYYAINVVGQFATVNDWEHFDGELNENVKDLLDKASQNVPTVTVTNVDGKTLVNRGESVKFQATTDVGVVTAALESDEYEWVVLDENSNITTSSTVVDNGDGTATLTVGDGEMSPGLYVAARSKAYGAVGKSAVAIQLYTVTVNGDTTVNANKTEQFSATVTADNTGETENSGVTWSVFGGNGASIINEESGLLSVDTAEADGAELTVMATSLNGGFIGTHTVTVANKYAVTVSTDSDYIDRGDTLQFSAEVTQNGEVVAPDGLLTVDTSVGNNTPLTVTATSREDINVSTTYIVTVTAEYELKITSDANEVAPGESLQYDATLFVNGIEDDSYSTLTWSVADSQGNAVSHASIDDSGKLTVSNDKYGTSELYVHAEHNATHTTSSLSVANVPYTLTLETTGTFAPEGLRVDVVEPYYNVGDITAAFTNNTGNTRYKYAVKEDSSGGVYLMLTHDDVYYEYADHGSRALTVTSTGGETDSVDFACNSHANTAYTPTAYEWSSDRAVTIFEHSCDTTYTHHVKLMDGSTQIDEKYVKWDITANSKASNTAIDSDGELCLELRERSPFVTIIYRTENAWGKKDFRIRYTRGGTINNNVNNLRLNLVAANWATSDLLRNNPDVTVTHGMNEDIVFIGNATRTFRFRIYDNGPYSNGKIIEEPLGFSIWNGDTNITGLDMSSKLYNGYIADTTVFNDGNGYYHIEIPYGNTTPITFWFTYHHRDSYPIAAVNNYGASTFEATIW